MKLLSEWAEVFDLIFTPVKPLKVLKQIAEWSLSGVELKCHSAQFSENVEITNMVTERSRSASLIRLRNWSQKNIFLKMKTFKIDF